MADELTLYSLSSAQLAGMNRLRRRAKRLVSLLKNSSPLVIVANEVLMIEDAAKLALGEEYYDAMRRRREADWLMLAAGHGRV